MGQILFTPSGAGVTSDDVTATKAQVLSGYTALTSDSDDEAASGSMTNNGAWTSSSSGSGKITIPAGYHNGSGYVDCSGAYNKGVTDADNRANSNSANYKAGYNAGITAADARVNTSSASYNNGYNAGVAAADARANTSSASYNSGYTNGWNACRQAAMANVWVTVKADAQYAGNDAVVSGWGSSNLTKNYGQAGTNTVDNGDNRHVSANIISWGGMPDAK